jgi:uncharacterized repeat protein (TIGR02543 family)
METLINAQYLKLVLEKKPTGGMQIIWQGDGNSWGWDSTDIITGAFVIAPDKGAAWDDETKTLTIDLTLALKNYEKLIDCTKAKFFIAYYSSNVDDLGILTADLIEKETPINFVFVTFDADGGDFNDDPDKDPILTKIVRIVKGQSMGSKFPANPLKEGFHIEKWVDAEAAEYDATTVINASVTLKPVWETGNPVYFTVSFDTDGGSAAPADVVVFDGSPLGAKFPAKPTKAGNVFMGWFDSESEEYDSSTSITGNVTLKAKWVAIVLPSAPSSSANVPDFAMTAVITVNGDPQGNGGQTALDQWLIGKGNIQGTDITTIKNAKAYSVLVAYVSCATTGKGNWGCGHVGNVDISIPGTYTVDEIFICRVDVAEFLVKLGSNNWASVDPQNTTTIHKIELWEPTDSYVPPLVVDLTGKTVKNEEAFTDQYQTKHWIALDLPADLLSKYTYVTIKANYYSPDDVLLTGSPQWNWGIGKFVDGASSYNDVWSRDDGNAPNLTEISNFAIGKKAGVVVTDIPTHLNVTSGGASSGTATVGYIEITEIKFFN